MPAVHAMDMITGKVLHRDQDSDSVPHRNLDEPQ